MDDDAVRLVDGETRAQVRCLDLNTLAVDNLTGRNGRVENYTDFRAAIKDDGFELAGDLNRNVLALVDVHLSPKK